MSADIVLRGVRVHNLKGVDVTIPTRKLVVVTGVSGSGKSSLAFDTLYAEGQRRYVESLSSYARQFLERMEKPQVDEVEGICPAIAIRQRTLSRSPRSTVATVTEIHDHLRLLFARAGQTVCDACGKVVERDSAGSAADRLIREPEGTPAAVGFELDASPDAATLAELQKRGYRRLALDGQTIDIEECKALPPEARPIVLVDRVALRAEERSRLAEALETAYREGHGRAVALLPEGRSERFSERLECRGCGQTFVEPEPRLFSFNNPFGACPTCHGFGNLIEIDLELVVPDTHKSLAEGAIEPWNKPHYRSLLQQLRRFARRRGIPLDVPWSFLEEGHRRLVLEGDESFPGVVGFFRWLEGRKYRVQVRAFLARYRGYHECTGCARRTAAARGAGGPDRRALDPRRVGDDGAVRRQFFRELRLERQRRAGGPARAATRSTGACRTSRTWASTT